MDIGTGKDLSEYHLANVNYHLIDMVEPGQKYHLHQFQIDFQNAYEQIRKQNKTPILCGGSGLYIEAALKPKLQTQIPENILLRNKLSTYAYQDLKEMWQGLTKDSRQSEPDTSTAKRLIRAIEINTYLQEHPAFNYSQRTSPDALIIGLMPDVELRRKNIALRLQKRFNEGMIDEVKALLDEGVTADDLIYYGLEYKLITQYLLGVLSYEQMHQKLLIAIQQFAKRQMTYFRKLEKDGLCIHWFKPNTI
jgi:tRNA dimethylallyltransferase